MKRQNPGDQFTYNELPVESFDFRIGSLCNGENGGCGCVEVALNEATADGGTVGMRDTKTGGTLQWTAHEWKGFVASVKAGEFDL